MENSISLYEVRIFFTCISSLQPDFAALRALVSGIREAHLSTNLLHPRMFYHRFKNGCNANFFLILVSLLRDSDLAIPRIFKIRAFIMITESRDEIHLAVLI